ncbi:Retrovirus-related Pol polyprotein from type-1 retrotransposable element R1 [Eumeta japonica]|uniref:Retrovirus-related Pol polyprotein from type-1 retrotransposable element R1 n=1 Tax=Eumeta variegata TaxID=151549 RepID=A0A4C1WUP6_EUMVA|nr:Retrovirus-related Pol polyprotein from type-1 retrotransposable element R1 [Eumeta japonica]
MLDARLNFKQQVEHVSAKASAAVTSLARLVPNDGGLKQTRRLLLSSMVTSVLTYGISIWADALDTQESLRKAGPVYRRSALRVASTFRTISEEAMCVISGTLLLRVLAEERRTLYQRRKSTTLSAEEPRTEEWQHSILQWQLQWDAAEKGRWTHRLIPRIDVWLNRSYEHVFFECPRFNSQRDLLESILHQKIQPETVIEVMLSSRASWNAISTFAKEVLIDLHSIERKRANDNN